MLLCLFYLSGPHLQSSDWISHVSKPSVSTTLELLCMTSWKDVRLVRSLERSYCYNKQLHLQIFRAMYVMVLNLCLHDDCFFLYMWLILEWSCVCNMFSGLKKDFLFFKIHYLYYKSVILHMCMNSTLLMDFFTCVKTKWSLHCSHCEKDRSLSDFSPFWKKTHCHFFCLKILSGFLVAVTEVNLNSNTEVSCSKHKMCHSSEKNQLWACGVNPPWQDCWDSSASTATLRELPSSPSTRQQSSHSGLRPIRMLQRWQARARSSFALCRYGCCGFFVFLREKPGDRVRDRVTETFYPF